MRQIGVLRNDNDHWVVELLAHDNQVLLVLPDGWRTLVSQQAAVTFARQILGSLTVAEDGEVIGPECGRAWYPAKGKRIVTCYLNHDGARPDQPILHRSRDGAVYFDVH